MEGPGWLYSRECLPDGATADLFDAPLPDDCRSEMKHKKRTCTLTTVNNKPNLSQVIDLEDYNSSYRLFRVTALVLRFIHCTRNRADNTQPSSVTDTLISVSDLEQARLLWIKDSQSQLHSDKQFPLWKHQLGLFLDESGVWKCGGRMSNSSLSIAAQTPILLDKKHHLTKLIAMDAHKRVMHDGVQETLAEFRSEYWLVRGRQFIRKLINGCVFCRKMEGRHCAGVTPPPLPSHRVRQSRPFQTTGVDFAGPLHVRGLNQKVTSKVWLCLYMCYSTRTVQFDCNYLYEEFSMFRSQVRDTIEDDI